MCILGAMDVKCSLPNVAVKRELHCMIDCTIITMGHSIAAMWYSGNAAYCQQLDCEIATRDIVISCVTYVVATQLGGTRKQADR